MAGTSLRQTLKHSSSFSFACNSDEELVGVGKCSQVGPRFGAGALLDCFSAAAPLGWAGVQAENGTRNRAKMNRVWLLCGDAPVFGIKTGLVFFNVKGPVAIKVCTQVDRSKLDNGLSHALSPAHAGTFHPIFD